MQALKAAGNLSEAGAEIVKIVAVLDRRDAPEERLGGFPFAALLRTEDLRVVNGD